MWSGRSGDSPEWQRCPAPPHRVVQRMGAWHLVAVLYVIDTCIHVPVSL